MHIPQPAALPGTWCWFYHAVSPALLALEHNQMSQVCTLHLLGLLPSSFSPSCSSPSCWSSSQAAERYSGIIEEASSRFSSCHGNGTDLYLQWSLYIYIFFLLKEKEGEGKKRRAKFDTCETCKKKRMYNKAFENESQGSFSLHYFVLFFLDLIWFDLICSLFVLFFIIHFRFFLSFFLSQTLIDLIHRWLRINPLAPWTARAALLRTGIRSSLLIIDVPLGEWVLTCSSLCAVPVCSRVGRPSLDPQPLTKWSDSKLLPTYDLQLCSLLPYQFHLTPRFFFLSLLPFAFHLRV